MGGTLVLLGQFITHRYTLRREERADLITAMERVIAAYMKADRAVSNLLSDVETHGPNHESVTDGLKVLMEMDHEIEAARWAVELRGDWTLAQALRSTEHYYDDMVSNAALGARGETERLAEARELFKGFYLQELNQMLATARESIHRKPFPLTDDDPEPRLGSPADGSERGEGLPPPDQ